jgi:hypothetical protein
VLSQTHTRGAPIIAERLRGLIATPGSGRTDPRSAMTVTTGLACAELRWSGRRDQSKRTRLCMPARRPVAIGCSALDESAGFLNVGRTGSADGPGSTAEPSANSESLSRRGALESAGRCVDEWGGRRWIRGGQRETFLV